MRRSQRLENVQNLLQDKLHAREMLDERHAQDMDGMWGTAIGKHELVRWKTILSQLQHHAGRIRAESKYRGILKVFIPWTYPWHVSNDRVNILPLHGLFHLQQWCRVKGNNQELAHESIQEGSQGGLLRSCDEAAWWSFPERMPWERNKPWCWLFASPACWLRRQQEWSISVDANQVRGELHSWLQCTHFA